MRKSPRFAVCLLSLLLTTLSASRAWADDFSEVAQLSREGKFVEAMAKVEVYLSWVAVQVTNGVVEDLPCYSADAFFASATLASSRS